MSRSIGCKNKIDRKRSVPKLELFNLKYLININNGCWEWVASLNNGGYGLFRVNKKMKLSHRVSYELFIGEIQSNIKICHSCDNPKCCNPFHLFSGTQAQNLEDARIKGRIPILKHPSITSYQHGCRCDECKNIAKRKYN